MFSVRKLKNMAYAWWFCWKSEPQSTACTGLSRAVHDALTTKWIFPEMVHQSLTKPHLALHGKLAFVHHMLDKGTRNNSLQVEVRWSPYPCPETNENPLQTFIWFPIEHATYAYNASCETWLSVHHFSMSHQTLRHDTRQGTFAQVNHPKRQQKSQTYPRIHAFKVSINLLAKRLWLALARSDSCNR